MGYDSPCWVWQRALDKQGYGCAWSEQRLRGAHRVIYELLVGPIPDGLELDHLCRVPACVNPDHLEPVSRSENIRRGLGAKLTRDQAREIKYGTEDSVALASRFGIDRNHVYQIRNGNVWKDV